MSTVRIFEPRDIPAAAALFERVHPEDCWISRRAFEAYLREILFENPWRDLELPSWAAEEDGRLAGFYAVVPRLMRLHGRPIRVAVGSQYIIEPEPHRNLIGLQLAKACLSGPQDLTLADGANDAARRIWIAVAGSAPLANSLQWTRVLRPAGYALSVLAPREPPLASLRVAARPLVALADGLAARLRPNRFLRVTADAFEEPLDAPTMLAHLPAMLDGYALQPLYDAGSLGWLLEQAARKTCHGDLRARAVRDGARRLLGWYLYYVRAGGVGEVLQMAAVPGAFERVLERLLAEAWRRGALALRGRLEPRFARELSERHCWMRAGGTWTLVHSRRRDVMDAIHEERAFLGRLEGEWWMRFLGEGGARRRAAPAAGAPERADRALHARVQP